MPGADPDRAFSCHGCPVWKRSLFADLHEHQVAQLDREKTPLCYEQDELLFDQGAPATAVYCIRSGVAKVFQKDAKGLVRIAPPGDTVGHRSVFTRPLYRASARASEALSACRVPKATLLHLLGKNPDFAQQIIMKMARDIEASEREWRTRYEKSARERLADLLLRLREACGEQQPDGSWKITVRVTKVDIAAMLGTAHETAIRLMTELKHDEILRQEGKTIFITDLPRLVAASGVRAPGPLGVASETSAPHKP